MPLTIDISEQEVYDEATSTFYKIKPAKLHFEHSLAAIAKWESKWHQPFMDNTEKDMVQLIDYIRCMCIDEDVDPMVFKGLSRKHMLLIEKYIDNPMTASWINDNKKKSKSKNTSEVMTSELMFFYMSQAQIPYECQYWPLSRLVMLLRIAGEKMSTDKNKVSKKDIMSRNAALNAQRRAKLHSKG